ncbi:diol dehydratase small subunit [Halalkalicoccus jeotgali]|uniref:Dehydratase small subunit n=1 Tax=Halalkalicoccus jeotgali (strain DSM 18796 / CECT 7217 / JCM 14584 / KCTC 4019 / B3) TaxID=795797 RepID=D8JB92_HALJB|nr:diol dehydratase small subunit [Halalkalicoccus jeotgali]ADJ16545.1 dehydratase small subunit [Halalkalicoccus jeotgali B3]ELY41359.1 propanediol dehydratase small subunit [Halalkalicoccus jeotgali B3]
MTNPNDVDYPLSENPDAVETPNGTALSEITLEAIVDGDIDGDDIVISPDTLEKQAAVAEDEGRPQLAQNFRRAAELTTIPDERLLEIYNALRPSGADKQTLQSMATELEEEYDARINAELVREAIAVYEKRGVV